MRTLRFNFTRQCACFFSSRSSPTQASQTSASIVDYLIRTIGLPEAQALRFSRTKNPENLTSVLNLLQDFGFSESQIQSSVRRTPQILFAKVDRTLKPKLQFFQQLGLAGSDLGVFVSKTSTLLTVSLEKKLIPCVEILKHIISEDDNNKYLIKVMQRCNGVVSVDPQKRLLHNISYFESCGIHGSQLSMLLKRQPRLFVAKESELQSLVSRVLDMGFTTDSRMFAHALLTVSCLSTETLMTKFNLFRSFNFSEEECMEMFRKAPVLLRASVGKLKLGCEFFLNTMKFKRTVLIHRPSILMNSMEERVVPRYIVLQILKTKGLLKKEPSFINILHLREEQFLDRFISRFREDAQELLVTYKGGFLDSIED